MARKGEARRKHKGEIGGITSRLVEAVSRYSTPLTVLVLLVLIAAGTYVRIVPALKYGLELDANDPWIAYWEAKWFHENGLFSFEGLTNVKEFWWPTGRDILHGDYIGLAWLAAATYPIGEAFGLSLKEWIALFPVFAGVLNIVTSFILVYTVTRSKLGGLVSSTFFALFPGAISRTTVGFVEKTGFATPFLALFYTFIFKAISTGDERRALRYSVIGGLFGASIAYLWGGYHLVTISLALIILLDPMFSKPSLARLKVYAAAGITYIVFGALSPEVPATYFVAGLGAVVPLALLLYAGEVYIDRIPVVSGMLEHGVTPRFQAWLLAVLFVLAYFAVSTRLIPVSNRLMAAVGVRQLSPLVESVQEHQPLGLPRIFQEYGIGLILTLVGIGFLLFRVLSGRREPSYALPRATIYLMALLLFYANLQLAYFTQMAAFYTTIASGMAIADIVGGAVESPAKGKRRKQVETGDPLRVLAGIFIVTIVAIGGAYYGYQAYTMNKYRAPQILTSGLGAFTMSDQAGNRHVVVPLNNAWINALEWIKNNTREDALIVSWWDYGYWITVNTGRKTVADGATMNETQIRALARLLTGSEGEANYILRNILRAEPNNTYIVFYEVFNGMVDLANNVTVFYPMPGAIVPPQAPNPGIVSHGAADFPKSAQMLRIGYRIPPFTPTPYKTLYSSVYVDQYGQRWYHFPGFIGEPEANVTTVRNSLIYKMAINGIAALPSVAVSDASCEAVLNATQSSIMAVVASRTTMGDQLAYLLPESGFNSFKPVALSISCPIVQQTLDRYDIVAVIVFIYQWTG